MIVDVEKYFSRASGWATAGLYVREAVTKFSWVRVASKESSDNLRRRGPRRREVAWAALKTAPSVSFSIRLNL
jgi:hypothetical protein